MYTKSTKIALGIVFIIVLIITIQLVGIISSRPALTLHHHVPTEASSVLKINNSNLFKQVFFDLLYQDSFDKNDIKQLEFRKSKTSIPETGIAMNREIIMFHEAWNNKNIIGFLFHLKNETQFAQFIGAQDGDFIKAFNASIGCVLFIPDLSAEEDPAFFEYYARDLLQPNPDRIKARLVLAQGRTTNLFHLYISGNEQSLIQDLSLETFLAHNKLIFEGNAIKNPTIEISSIPVQFISSPKNPDYFEIHATRLPDTLNVYLKKILSQLNTSLPTISSQQLLMYGFNIENIEGKTAVIPLFDAVFRFVDTLELTKIQDELSTSLISMDEQLIRIGGTKFYLQQLSPTEIYVGVSSHPTFDQRNITYYFYMGGNPAAIMNLSGQGIVAQIAQLLPPVQHTKQFLSEVKEFRFTAEPFATKDSIEVKGIIELAPDKIASIELIKYLLKF